MAKRLHGVSELVYCDFFQGVKKRVNIHLCRSITSALPWGLFGPEWTFTGPGIMDSYSINTTAWQMLLRFSKQIMSKCNTCQISTAFPEIVIRYHNMILSPSGDSRNLAINLENAHTIEIRGLRPQ